MSAVQRGVPRRERVRAATIEEIKRTALALMHEQGTTEVRFTDIARIMEMTPPALYRYFADRDELLSALITDAYNDLGDSIARARDAAAPDGVWARWVNAAQAYRQWACREPQQFALILGLPLPGYAAPKDGPTTEAAQRALAQLSSLFVEALSRGELGRPTILQVHPTLVECVQMKNEDLHVEIPPESFQAMLHAWCALHGFTCLEAYGHLEWLPQQAREALFLGQIRLAAMAAGLPVGPAPEAA